MMYTSLSDLPIWHITHYRNCIYRSICMYGPFSLGLCFSGQSGKNVFYPIYIYILYNIKYIFIYEYTYSLHIYMYMINFICKRSAAKAQSQKGPRKALHAYIFYTRIYIYILYIYIYT